jgi:hypothetical protein
VRIEFESGLLNLFTALALIAAAPPSPPLIAAKPTPE